MSEWSFTELQKVLDWPIREVLLRYVALMKDEAASSYRIALVVWAAKTSMGGKNKPPDLPEILRDR